MGDQKREQSGEKDVKLITKETALDTLIMKCYITSRTMNGLSERLFQTET